MTKDHVELLQGTLDMLILKSLSLNPMHGFGISVRIRQISKEVLRVEQCQKRSVTGEPSLIRTGRPVGSGIAVSGPKPNAFKIVACRS